VWGFFFKTVSTSSFQETPADFSNRNKGWMLSRSSINHNVWFASKPNKQIFDFCFSRN